MIMLLVIDCKVCHTHTSVFLTKDTLVAHFAIRTQVVIICNVHIIDCTYILKLKCILDKPFPKKISFVKFVASMAGRLLLLFPVPCRQKSRDN